MGTSSWVSPGGVRAPQGGGRPGVNPWEMLCPKDLLQPPFSALQLILVSRPKTPAPSSAECPSSAPRTGGCGAEILGDGGIWERRQVGWVSWVLVTSSSTPGAPQETRSFLLQPTPAPEWASWQHEAMYGEDMWGAGGCKPSWERVGGVGVESHFFCL